MSIQNKRRESMYFKAVSVIVSEINNANISNPTVTDVKLSNDGSVLNVYVTFEKNKERSFENILNTKGFVRSELSRLSNQRIVPNVIFKYDKTAESAARIEEILQDIKNNK